MNTNEKIELVTLKNSKQTMPTAVFFDFEEWSAFYGCTAVEKYIDEHSGKLLRSLKSVLGSQLMNEPPQIGHDKYGFSEIVGFFVAHIKETAELRINSSLEHTVLGSPVYCVDDDPTADKRA